MSLPLSYSQTDFLLGFHFSGSTYFGDLAPDNKTGSFSKFHLGMGFLIEKEILDHVSVSFNYDHATLSGDDKKSDVLERRIRNLSFISPIDCITLIMKYRIPIAFQQKIGIQFGTGIAGFVFDPRATLNGQLYRLQPLRTEGQGLVGRSLPYKLSKLALPMQLGLWIRLTSNIFLEPSLNYFYTNTDYLDDVSGDYADNDLLRKYKGTIAADLADRHLEVLPNDIHYPAGQGRGNPSRFDQFLIFKLGVTFRLGESISSIPIKRVNCPFK